MNIEKYLQRIEYNGDRRVNLENLKKLCWCHATHVPQFTLDLFGGEGKQFDMKAIYHKIVVKRQGGFCYELNGLFGELLQDLGFKIDLLEGSCYLQGKDEFNFPFDHLLLQVTLDGEKWIVDVGYGAPSFFMPMQLILLKEQTEMTGIYRLRKLNDGEDSFLVEKKHKQSFDMDSGKQINPIMEKQVSKYSKGDEWDIIFRFSTLPRLWEDFEVGWNQQLSNKNGFFRTNSFLEIFNQSGLKVLWGTKLLEKEFPDPLTEKLRCTDLLIDDSKSRKDINNAMKEYFGVTLDYEPAFCSKNFKLLVR